MTAGICKKPENFGTGRSRNVFSVSIDSDKSKIGKKWLALFANFYISLKYVYFPKT